MSNFNQLYEDNKRLVIRGGIKQWNQMLAETEKRVGIIDEEEYAHFQNAGYMGLYGGETVSDIHKRISHSDVGVLIIYQKTKVHIKDFENK